MPDHSRVLGKAAGPEHFRKSLMDGLNQSIYSSVTQFTSLKMGLKRPPFNFLECTLPVVFCAVFLRSGAESLACGDFCVQG